VITGVVLVVLGALSLAWIALRGRAFADRHRRDRAMPWIGSGEPYGWTRKAFAALPLPLDRALHLLISVAMIAGGIWTLTR
jgi:hypothetical protein